MYYSDNILLLRFDHVKKYKKKKTFTVLDFMFRLKKKKIANRRRSKEAFFEETS